MEATQAIRKQGLAGGSNGLGLLAYENFILALVDFLGIFFLGCPSSFERFQFMFEVVQQRFSCRILREQALLRKIKVRSVPTLSSNITNVIRHFTTNNNRCLSIPRVVPVLPAHVVHSPASWILEVAETRSDCRAADHELKRMAAAQLNVMRGEAASAVAH